MFKNLFQQNSNKLNILIGINTVIFVLAILVDLSYGFKTRGDLTAFGAFGATEFLDGQYWLAVTSTFLHIGLFHFLFNIYALLKIGELVNNFYGEKKLVFVYVFGGIVGNLLGLIHFQYLGGDSVVSLGASGAIFALLGLLVGGTLKNNRYGRDLPFRIQDFYPILFLSLIISFLPQVDLWAHLGGFLFGFAGGFVFNSKLNTGIESSSERSLIDFGYYISIALIIISFLALIFNFFI